VMIFLLVVKQACSSHWGVSVAGRGVLYPSPVETSILTLNSGRSSLVMVIKSANPSPYNSTLTQAIEHTTSFPDQRCNHTEATETETPGNHSPFALHLRSAVSKRQIHGDAQYFLRGDESHRESGLKRCLSALLPISIDLFHLLESRCH